MPEIGSSRLIIGPTKPQLSPISCIIGQYTSAWSSSGQVRKRRDLQRTTKGVKIEGLLSVQAADPALLARVIWNFVPPSGGLLWTRGCDPAAWVVMKPRRSQGWCDPYAGHRLVLAGDRRLRPRKGRLLSVCVRSRVRSYEKAFTFRSPGTPSSVILP